MLLGMHGQKGVGKDTVYTMIKDTLQQDKRFIGHRVVRDAFADRLKISAARALGVMRDELWMMDQLKGHGRIRMTITGASGLSIVPMEQEITGREYLQFYGSEAHRDVFGRNFWVDQVLPDPHEEDYGRGDGLFRDDALVITDVRLPNEAERILQCSGSVWKIERGPDNKDIHSTEQPLPASLITHTIDNNGTLAALRQQVVTQLQREQTGVKCRVK